jgi:predicted Rossmann fold nucleotide-binding protein DprA/Smf involved in DNA uptake
VYLELVDDDAATHLRVVGLLEEEQRHILAEQVLDRLNRGDLTRAKLREQLSVKNERLGEVLKSLEQGGQIRRTAYGWQRAD